MNHLDKYTPTQASLETTNKKLVMKSSCIKTEFGKQFPWREKNQGK